jgi:hypothetical protein
MLIQIETENLIKEKITPNDYIILKLLFENQYSTLQKLFPVTSTLTNNLKILEYESYLKMTVDELDWTKISTQIFLRQKTIDLFIVKKSAFLTWWNMYPTKVGIGNNIRVLKTFDADTNLGRKCKQKFDRITNNDPIKENQLIKGLEIELEIKKKSNSMQYMQLVDVWLNQETYQKYIHLIDQPIENDNERIDAV